MNTQAKAARKQLQTHSAKAKLPRVSQCQSVHMRDKFAVVEQTGSYATFKTLCGIRYQLISGQFLACVDGVNYDRQRNVASLARFTNCAKCLRENNRRLL